MINAHVPKKTENKETCSGRCFFKETGERCAACDQVNHPQHYGGSDNIYEAIKVIEAHHLNFCLGNAIKYILRAGKKDDLLQDLRKAKFYLDREIDKTQQNVDTAAKVWNDHLAK